MLGLKLRDEFLGNYMPQTAIRLVSNDKTGAAQQDPETILEITYPTSDIQNALRALSEKRQGRPIVIMGDRGRGKSHIMAVMHHAIAASGKVEAWAHNWGKKIDSPVFSDLNIQKGFFAISEPVHNNEYMLLWNLIFDRHPQGQRFRGRFEATGQPIPSRKLLEEMFEAQPTALILDEFQTWFDGLHDETGAQGRKWRQSAFNFIQILSELAKDRPQILILIISVLNNKTQAFQQVHRDTPVNIDFRGPTAKEDRQKLLLHRLFKNRDKITPGNLKKSVTPYASERFRLKLSHLSESEKETRSNEVMKCWPFSPELVELLEDHILMAQAAQETRDLIRILAQVYRARGENVPLITPADFFIDDDSCGVQSLLDSIATMGSQEKLREVAQRNLQNIKSLGTETVHTREILSSLWMRSMSPGRNRGGTRNELHIDITRSETIDDNSFNAELEKIISSSVNIHGEEIPEGRLHFDIDENPRSKVRSTARNDKLWHSTADPQVIGQICYPGKDVEYVRKFIRGMFMPEIRQHISQAIVLGPNWRTDPWNEVEEEYRPARWNDPVLLVVPEAIPQEDVAAVLGPWLTKQVQNRRNTIRFLLAKSDTDALFADEATLFNARCSYLVSQAWKDDPQYKSLKGQFDKSLRDELKARFDRFAVLDVWNFKSPEQCRFSIEKLDTEGSEIPERIEEKILKDLFDPAEFEKFIIARAQESYIMNDVLAELMDPGSEAQAIPYLGETKITEKVFEIAAKGQIALNIGGTWYGRLPEHQSDEEALRAIRKNFRDGLEMRKMQLSLPNVLGTPLVRSPVVSQVSTAGSSANPGDVTVPVLKPSQAQAVKEEVNNGTDNQTGSVEQAVKTIRFKSDGPSIGVNLTGSFEKWGVSSDVSLKTATIEFTDLTVNQVKQILTRIPSSIKASLEVSFTQEEKP